MRSLLTTAVMVWLLGPGPAQAWQLQHPVHTPDPNVTEAAVAPYMAMSASQLRALITTAGGVKGSSNHTLKTVAYDLARLYHKTKQPLYADRAVLLLERYAEVLPKWPIIARDGVTPTPLDKVNWGAWDAGGLWGVWFHLDLREARELALAYDLVVQSGALERRGQQTGRDVRALIEKDLLRYMVDVTLHFQENKLAIDGVAAEDCSYSNLLGYMVDGLIPFGRVLDPAYIHIVVRWLRNILRVGYFRDGYWHEGTASYHRQITLYIKKNVEALAGYSDPAGYVYQGYVTRFADTFAGSNARHDNLDVTKGHEAAYARALARVQALALPNARYYALHDTTSTQKTWAPAPAASEPVCLFGLRHAVLARGQGKAQLQAHLHFGGTDGHEHYDCLNLGLWALGGELLSEGEYRGLQEWNMATAGHNTVVVDEADQHGRFKNQVKLTADDAVDGVGFYLYQSYGQSNGRNFGNLRLWDAARDQLQVVEAEGHNAYATEATLYRRTVVLVQSAADDVYLIDLFRVRGGATHDWMLHGRLDEDYGFWSDLPLQPATGTRFKHLALEGQATTGKAWSMEFRYTSGARLRTTMLGHAGTQVSRGRAPAMRREGDATFVDVRRTGGDSLFVAVHEPHRGAPRIKRVTPLLFDGRAGSPLALRIDLEGGRSDIFASTLDAPPFKERKIPGTDVAFRGRLLHVSRQGGQTRWAYLLQGAGLELDGARLYAEGGDLGYRGTIAEVARRERKASWDGFVATGAVLPTDGRLDGRTLLLTLPDGRTEGYAIERVEAAPEGGFRLHVQGEPGLELRDGGKLVKHVYYPHTGLRGALTFQIPGSLYRGAGGAVQATARLQLPPGGEGAAEDPAAGCSCRAAGGPGPAAPWLVVLWALVLRRRGSRRGPRRGPAA